MAALSPEGLREVVSELAQKLDSLKIDYAIMGGAATCLLSQDPSRKTTDVDFVIHVDDRGITADLLTNELLNSSPSKFEGVIHYGHTIPAYKLLLPGEPAQLVELEAFDYQSWPQRPQYKIETATRKTLNINGQGVKVFSAEWILREKILSQYQRQGSNKEGNDLQDIINMIPLTIPGRPELDFTQDKELEAALTNLLEKNPTLAQTLKSKIKCGILQN
ncbi:hypothetical protein OCU04_009234 [Sclerotinia nivalis]|uniref:Uncharacterized protein n=1 Tax=Sclerotinia nivalis TaxID=352851 RepID=A0A9X0DH41_9HELO|nr:hypothetical protein OCU04_009234 [Sclerotinia nivalis]